MSWGESWWITRNIVKSIQKGKTTSAQTVYISRVNLNRSIVLSVSKGSAGYVASSGNLTANTTLRVNQEVYDDTYRGEDTTCGIKNVYSSGTRYDKAAVNATENQTIAITGSVSGGSTDLTVKQYSATLTSPTTLYCDGACEWQVIEFY